MGTGSYQGDTCSPCNPMGSLLLNTTGACECYPGFSGPTCYTLAPFPWQYSLVQASALSCLTLTADVGAAGCFTSGNIVLLPHFLPTPLGWVEGACPALYQPVEKTVLCNATGAPGSDVLLTKFKAPALLQ